MTSTLRALVFLAAVIMASLAPAPRAVAQAEYGALAAPFNASRLTWDERRFLQLSLALVGQYNGLLDGDWGPMSARAFSRYTSQTFGSAPVNLHMAALAFEFFSQVGEEGWDFTAFPGYGGSILFPLDAAQERPRTGSFRNWVHLTSSLSYAFARSTLNQALEHHAYVASRHRGRDPLYTVRKPDLLVTSAKTATGGVVYARSDLIFGSWRTVILSADEVDANLAMAVSASISPAPPRPLRFPDDGFLARVIEDFIAIAEEETAPAPPESVAREMPPSSPKRSSGTGFLVMEDGLVMTNKHVVEGCRQITVNGSDAALVAMSDIFDLALVKASDTRGLEPAVFASRPAALNSDVTAAGYPYFGILDGLNVTRGSVSSLKGIGGDGFTMQISAPVQPGNSGGPLLNEYGQVVGVVVARLDKAAIAKATGSLPENVNFAVRGEAAKLFLAQNGVDRIEISDASELRSNVELGRVAKAITVLIECER